jgi:hypothetical protein
LPGTSGKAEDIVMAGQGFVLANAESPIFSAERQEPPVEPEN